MPAGNHRSPGLSVPKEPVRATARTSPVAASTRKKPAISVCRSALRLSEIFWEMRSVSKASARARERPARVSAALRLSSVSAKSPALRTATAAWEAKDTSSDSSSSLRRSSRRRLRVITPRSSPLATTGTPAKA